jgi:hypothetical protein
MAVATGRAPTTSSRERLLSGKATALSTPLLQTSMKTEITAEHVIHVQGEVIRRQKAQIEILEAREKINEQRLRAHESTIRDREERIENLQTRADIQDRNIRRVEQKQDRTSTGLKILAVVQTIVIIIGIILICL